MNDNKEKEATGAQYAQFGLMVSLRTTKTLGEKNFSFDAMQQLLGDPYKPVDSIVDKVVREIFGINFDKWAREKEKTSKFYEVCFGIKVDWKGIVIPTGPAEFNHLELILKGLTRFHSLLADGNAMYMCGNGRGQFRISGSDRGNRDSDHGPRQVVF